jgi:hypothetical protein
MLMKADRNRLDLPPHKTAKTHHVTTMQLGLCFACRCIAALDAAALPLLGCDKHSCHHPVNKPLRTNVSMSTRLRMLQAPQQRLLVKVFGLLLPTWPLPAAPSAV